MHYSQEKLELLTQRWATAKGKKLLKIIKQSHCYLSPVLFHQKIGSLPFINDKEVKDCVDLRGAPLSSFDFRVSVQEEDDGFIEDLAVLSTIHFEGANLKHANFTEGKILNCNFENAYLSHSELCISTINNCDFTEADLSGANLHGTKLIDCTFTNSSIKDVSLDTTFVDEKTHFGKTLKSETEGSFHLASVEYKQIKEMYKNSSLHSQADFYHYKEMVAKRKSSSITSLKRWLNFFFGDLLCKYGTSYTRVFSWCLIAVFAFAIGFDNHGLGANGLVFENTFGDAVYFSLVTFTTLGYGDLHAIGNMRYLAGAESFMGVVLMSLFTVIVARKIIRD